MRRLSRSALLAAAVLATGAGAATGHPGEEHQAATEPGLLQVILDEPAPGRFLAPGSSSWSDQPRVTPPTHADVAPPTAARLRRGFPRIVIRPGRDVVAHFGFTLRSASVTVAVPVRRAGESLTFAHRPLDDTLIDTARVGWKSGPVAGILIVSGTDATDRGTIGGQILVMTDTPVRCAGWLKQYRKATRDSTRSAALGRLLRSRCADPAALPTR